MEEKSFLDLVREVAVYISNTYGEVSIDMLRVSASLADVKPAHPNLWGEVFRGSDWRCIGTRRSAHRPAHGRIVKIWKHVA